MLICIRCHDYRRQDLILGVILYALVPCHLFIAYIIEIMAAQNARKLIGHMKRDESQKSYERGRKSFQSTWRRIAWVHAINASLCLLITTMVVYTHIHHPLIGTISEIHSIIVLLKICSYALTNRDLRHAMLASHPASSLPQIYSECPYPRNITARNLSYFWWAPTLIYQPVYPRSGNIRWFFVAKRIGEFLSLSVFIWLASAQYAAPVLRNSLIKIASLDVTSIIERLMKLSTISLIIWLAGFFAIFQSCLNALAEVMRFGDRKFYGDWWNSPSVGAYWKTWNLPVHHFMARHVYFPLIGRGWSAKAASAMVFVISGFLHELAVGAPTHNFLGLFHRPFLPLREQEYTANRTENSGVAFVGMIVQIPLILATHRLERNHDVNSQIIGNCIFWVSFCLVGQPLALLLYFFAWQAKHGSVSKQHV